LRPVVGVLGELIVLAGVIWAGYFITGGSFYFLYVVITELLATYLVHCPAHYVVGKSLGIRFVSMRLGRTTLAKALPPRLSRFARLIPILTLSTDRSALSRITRGRVSAMYASGTVASVLSAFVVAAWATPGASLALLLVAWVIAFGYLAFDLVFSPKSGDLMRARKARRGSSEPLRAQK
jgi:hypothetical protein